MVLTTVDTFIGEGFLPAVPKADRVRMLQLFLIKDLRSKVNTAVLLITHDIGVVAEMADEVIVMYTGKVVEQGDVISVFKNPKHPYTVGLLSSIPSLGVKNQRLNVIPGTVPSPLNLPKGCTFAPRCGLATDQCRADYPPLVQHRPGHWVSCWHAERLLDGAA